MIVMQVWGLTSKCDTLLIVKFYKTLIGLIGVDNFINCWN